MRPTPSLCVRGRVRFTTKQVGGGFYRGSRTGAMGAHTEYGGYLIDYRKVRHFVVPDLKGFNLTPFVSYEIEKPPTVELYDGGQRYTTPMVDPKGFLRTWRTKNLSEYHEVLEYQKQSMGAKEEEVLVEPRAEQRSQQESVPWYKRPFVKSRTLVVDKDAGAPAAEGPVAAKRPKK